MTPKQQRDAVEKILEESQKMVNIYENRIIFF